MTRSLKRQRLVGFSAAVVLTLVSALFAAGSARAGVTTCTGAVTSQTINASVVVPAGATCLLVHDTVNGNVSVQRGATLGLLPVCDEAAFCVGSIVSGNVEAHGATAVGVGFSQVGGNMSIMQTGTLSLDRSAIGGNVTLSGNQSLAFHFSAIAGSLVCTNNTTVDGLFAVAVGGQALGQCKGAGVAAALAKTQASHHRVWMHLHALGLGRYPKTPRR